MHFLENNILIFHLNIKEKLFYCRFGISPQPNGGELENCVAQTYKLLDWDSNWEDIQCFANVCGASICEKVFTEGEPRLTYMVKFPKIIIMELQIPWVLNIPQFQLKWNTLDSYLSLLWKNSVEPTIFFQRNKYEIPLGFSEVFPNIISVGFLIDTI